MHEPSPHVDSLANRVIGAAIAVHRQLGPGFLESLYEEALACELDHLEIQFSRQAQVEILYRTKVIGTHRLDLLVEGQLVVELKAVESLLAIHQAQVASYLRATNLQLGLLINFNVPILKQGLRRIIHTPS